jgi:uncharacterized membrane protein
MSPSEQRRSSRRGAGYAERSMRRRGHRAAQIYRHPVNKELLDDAPIGARIADHVTGFLGSWTFIVIQTAIVAGWVLGNIYLLFHFDPYPFIFLNLAFSTQAAYAAPLILLASNRSSARDRMTLEHAAAEADIEDEQNERLLTGNIEILKKVEGLEKQILDLENRIMERLEGRPG